MILYHLDIHVLLVSKLEPDIIKKAIQSFINEEDDAYCSKIYHTASILNLKDLNEVLDSQQKRAILPKNLFFYSYVILR